jgi:diguanylate cyclase (GGDEF)-like protein
MKDAPSAAADIALLPTPTGEAAVAGESEHLFRALVESASDLVCTFDVDGTVRYASPSAIRALPWRTPVPVGACLWDFVHPDDLESVHAHVRREISAAPGGPVPGGLPGQTLTTVDGTAPSQSPGSAWEVRLRVRDGSWRTFEVSCRSLLGDPVVRAITFNAHDVSERKEAEADLMQAALHDRLSGLPNRALFMSRLRARVERWKRENSGISGIAPGSTASPPEPSFTNDTNDTVEERAFDDLRDRIGEAAGVGGEFGAESLNDGAYDGGYEVGREGMFAVLFLDFDRFKIINDSLGHAVGDELLKAAARRLETCLRPGDTVARLGGDEFAVLLEEISAPSDAVQVAERIQKALGAVFSLRRVEERDGRGAAQSSSHDVFIAASIGIALGGDPPQGVPYERADDVLRDADMAMYRAKEKGRARHEIFSSHMHEQALGRLQMETDLRRSLENGDFRVHYQPIIAFETGLLNGFEALVRWHHPRHGLVSPGEFLGVAEETGLIGPLGWWVLREACGQLRKWMDELRWEGDPALHTLTINVNLSARQFGSDELPAQIAQVLAESRLQPHNLKLEITEATLITQAAAAARQLPLLHDMGVQLGLDDFGTGYSSLSYLHRFPINSLKIDRSFVSDLSAGHNASIVSTIIALARQLNLDVVAEGVETDAQADALRDMDCPRGQGFYFSQPLTRKPPRCS